MGKKVARAAGGGRHREEMRITPTVETVLGIVTNGLEYSEFKDLTLSGKGAIQWQLFHQLSLCGNIIPYSPHPIYRERLRSSTRVIDL